MEKLLKYFYSCPVILGEGNLKTVNEAVTLFEYADYFDVPSLKRILVRDFGKVFTNLDCNSFKDIAEGFLDVMAIYRQGEDDELDKFFREFILCLKHQQIFEQLLNNPDVERMLKDDPEMSVFIMKLLVSSYGAKIPIWRGCYAPLD